MFGQCCLSDVLSAERTLRDMAFPHPNHSTPNR
jgi:hypothetical protein